MDPALHPLIEQAMRKAAVAWLAIPGGAPYPVWCLWLDGCLYAVGGPGEQPAPGLAEVASEKPAVPSEKPAVPSEKPAVASAKPAVAVTARGNHGGRIVTWPASVGRVEPGSEEWDRVVPQLAGKRLNAPGGARETAERWARECVVSRLVPVGDPTEAGPDLPTDAGAAPPVPTPAARRTCGPPATP